MVLVRANVGLSVLSEVEWTAAKSAASGRDDTVEEGLKRNTLLYL
jgi:hypothetical protein